MTSCVAEVLITNGQLVKADLDEKISDIHKKIAKLKNDVKDFINDNHMEFVPSLKKGQALALQAEKFVEEMQILEARIQDQIKVELSGSTKELKELSAALKESNLSLRMSKQLLELSESFETIKTHKREKRRLVEAAKTLQRVNDLLNSPDTDLQSLNIYKSLQTERANCYADFQNDVISMWKKNVCWKQTKNDVGSECTNLTIDCEPEEIQDIVRALHYVDSLDPTIAQFSVDLLKNLIVPIISSNDSMVRVYKEKVFTVEHGQGKNVKPIYKSVLYNLKLLLQFLRQHLDITITNDDRFVVLLSAHLLEPLSTKLIDDCISDTIPGTSEELENFDGVMKEIDEFQNYLLEIGFIDETQRFLSEYTKDVDQLFIDKICQGLLAKASAIAHKDLHNSFRHEPEEPLNFLADCQTDKQIERKLSKQTFQLPACQISESARDILNLVREILEEACTSSEVCAIRLFYTSRNVFEIYASTVPEYHKKFLDTIPQQVALFHNNCMYLSHHLLSLAHEYKDRLPDDLQKHNITYADLTLVMRKVGSECFLEHMKYQRNMILDILRESRLSQLGQTPKLPPSTEKAFRQCIRQLEFLKTVWMDVLPINIYCRAVGCITNSMIEDIVMKVVSVEDIPADVATELVTLFELIVKRTPLIFSDPKTIHRHVNKWAKLTELIKVLEASLKEIEDRWADGKGPLANEFTSSQVKQLIRALFQNTERRSALLASIK